MRRNHVIGGIVALGAILWGLLGGNNVTPTKGSETTPLHDNNDSSSLEDTVSSTSLKFTLPKNAPVTFSPEGEDDTKTPSDNIISSKTTHSYNPHTLQDITTVVQRYENGLTVTTTKTIDEISGVTETKQRSGRGYGFGTNQVWRSNKYGELFEFVDSNLEDGKATGRETTFYKMEDSSPVGTGTLRERFYADGKLEWQERRTYGESELWERESFDEKGDIEFRWNLVKDNENKPYTTSCEGYTPRWENFCVTQMRK